MARFGNRWEQRESGAEPGRLGAGGVTNTLVGVRAENQLELQLGPHRFAWIETFDQRHLDERARCVGWGAGSD